MFAGAAIVNTPGVTCFEPRFSHSGNGAFVGDEYKGEYDWSQDYWRYFSVPSNFYSDGGDYSYYRNGNFRGDYQGSGLPRCIRGEGTGDDGFAPWEQNCEFTTKQFEVRHGSRWSLRGTRRKRTRKLS